MHAVMTKLKIAHLVIIETLSDLELNGGVQH